MQETKSIAAFGDTIYYKDILPLLLRTLYHFLLFFTYVKIRPIHRDVLHKKITAFTAHLIQKTEQYFYNAKAKENQ